MGLRCVYISLSVCLSVCFFSCVYVRMCIYIQEGDEILKINGYSTRADMYISSHKNGLVHMLQ